MKLLGSISAGLGALVTGLGYLSFFVFGLWGLYVECVILNHVWGFAGVVLGVMVAPIAYLAAPIYALIQWNDATPLLINYGGGIFSMLLIGTGMALSAVADKFYGLGVK